jgi:hypothetical protein
LFRLEGRQCEKSGSKPCQSANAMCRVNSYFSLWPLWLPLLQTVLKSMRSIATATRRKCRTVWIANQTPAFRGKQAIQESHKEEFDRVLLACTRRIHLMFQCICSRHSPLRPLINVPDVPLRVNRIDWLVPDCETIPTKPSIFFDEQYLNRFVRTNDSLIGSHQVSLRLLCIYLKEQTNECKNETHHYRNRSLPHQTYLKGSPSVPGCVKIASNADVVTLLGQGKGHLGRRRNIQHRRSTL